jgi:hypothetical protein
MLHNAIVTSATLTEERITHTRAPATNITLQTFPERKKGLLFSVVTSATVTEERMHTH